MGKRVTPELRSLVISCRKKGKSLGGISKEFDLPKSTVQRICNRHFKENNVPVIKNNGKLTEADKEFLVKENNKYPNLSWKELGDRLLEHSGTDISRGTVRRFFSGYKQKMVSGSECTSRTSKNVPVQSRVDKDSSVSCGLDSLIMPSVDQQSEMATMSTKPIEVFDTYKSSDQEEVNVVSDSIEVFDTYKRPEEERDSDEESFHLRLEDDDVEACGPVNESVLDDEDQILDKFQKDLEKTGADKCDEQAANTSTTTRKRPAEDDAEEEVKTKSSRIEESTNQGDLDEQRESEAKAGPSSEPCIAEESIDENNQTNVEEPATELDATNKEEEDEPGEEKVHDDSQEEQTKLVEDPVEDVGENLDVTEPKDVPQSEEEQQQTQSTLDGDVVQDVHIANDPLKPQSELGEVAEEDTETKLDGDAQMDVDVKIDEVEVNEENKIEHVQLEETEKVNEDAKLDDKLTEDEKFAEDDDLPEDDKLNEDRLTEDDRLTGNDDKPTKDTPSEDDLLNEDCKLTTEDDKTEGDRLAEDDNLAEDQVDKDDELTEDDKLLAKDDDLDGDDDLAEDDKLNEDHFVVVDESNEEDKSTEDVKLGEDDDLLEQDKEPSEDDQLIGDDKPSEQSNVNVDDKVDEGAQPDEDALLEEPETAESKEEKLESCLEINEKTNKVVEEIEQDEEAIVPSSATDDQQLLVKDSETNAVVNNSSSDEVSAETDKTEEIVENAQTSGTTDVTLVESDTAKVTPSSEETMEVVDEKTEADSEKQLEEILLNDEEDKLEEDVDSENKTTAVDEDKLLVDDAEADCQEKVAQKTGEPSEAEKSQVPREDADSASKVDSKPSDDTEKTDDDPKKIQIMPQPVPTKNDPQLDKLCESSNDSSDDLMDISIIRDAAEDNAENAYNEAFPEGEASEDSESREHSDKDEEASCDKPEEDEDEEEEDTDNNRTDHFEAEEAKVLNEGESEEDVRLSSAEGKAEDSAAGESVGGEKIKDKVADESVGEETTRTESDSKTESSTDTKELEVDDGSDQKLLTKDDVELDKEAAVGEDKESGSTNQRLSSGSLKRPASDAAEEEVVAKKSKTLDEVLENSTSADDEAAKDLNSECNISDVINQSETSSATVESSPVVLPAETLPSTSRTVPSPKHHVPESLLSLAQFMKNRKPSKLTKYDLEEFCLQKICEAVVHKSEMGEIHHQLKVQETLVDNMKREIQQLSKQVRDLEIVNKKLMNDLKQQQQTGVQKHLAPLKITRSVGLQVKFTPINPLDAKRKSSNCPVHPKNVPIPIGTGQLISSKGGQRVIQVNAPSSIRNLQQVEKPPPNPKIDKVMQKLRRVAEGKPANASKTGSPRNRGLDDVITFSDSDSEISSDRSRVASPARNEVQQNTSSPIVHSQDSQDNRHHSDSRAQNVISHTNTAPHAQQSQATVDSHPSTRPLKAPHKTRNINNPSPVSHREVQQKQSLKSSTPILTQALLQQQNRRASSSTTTTTTPSTSSSSSDASAHTTNRNNPQASGSGGGSVAPSPGGGKTNTNGTSPAKAVQSSSVIDLTDEDDSRKNSSSSSSSNNNASSGNTSSSSVKTSGGAAQQQTRTAIATIQQQKSHAPLHQGVILRTASGQPVRAINANQVRLTGTAGGQGKPMAASVVTSSAGGVVGGPQLMYVVQSGPGQNAGGNGAKAVVVNFQPTNGVLASTLNGSSVSVIPKTSSTVQLKTVSSSPGNSKPTGSAGGPKSQRKHPAPLPYPPLVRINADKNLKPIPPKPHLTIRKTETGIILQWRMPYELDLYEEIASYQLYAYQETNAPPSTDMWRRVGDVKALALPMACTLTQFADKNRYYFAVRPVDVHKRIGAFSNPEEISL